jgi:[ribosomal protein S5]-alanine N-acetyltransferase
MDLMLSTDQLQIINCDLQMVKALLRGNATLSLFLGVEVPRDWTESGSPSFQCISARLREFPNDAKWWAWLAVLREENRLVGSCGYKGAPNADGEVEIGYEIAASHRRMGLGTEVALALRDFAFGHREVTKVKAHTLAGQNASTRILERCGMTRVAEVMDDADGSLWRWEIDRETYCRG